MLAPAMMPEIDEMLMIEPPSRLVCFLISATPCLQPRNTPSRSTACTCRHSSSVMSSTVLPSPMPAEFSSTWSAPNLSTVSRIAAFQLSSLVTSSFRKWPAEPSLSATALPRSAAMSATTTLAPSCAIRIAALAPRPEAPPVTSATLPFRRSVMRSSRPGLAPGRAGHQGEGGSDGSLRRNISLSDQFLLVMHRCRRWGCAPGSPPGSGRAPRAP